MLVDGVHRRAIWADEKKHVYILDQIPLPHDISWVQLKNVADCVKAIASMQVRGAPLIGAAAAYGLYLAMQEDASDQHLVAAYEQLLATRPTAINLRWALDMVRSKLSQASIQDRASLAFDLAEHIADEDVRTNRRLGEYVADTLEAHWESKGKPSVFNILTHCNAGWLATVDWGTALSGVYILQERGIPVHVWVDETRPRNQGARLTAWELSQQGVNHTVIVDNVGGHLMQHGLVDCCIVGTDRTTRQGDVCNKVGTYLKALAAHDNQVPFYVATPSSSIDWNINDGVREIPIEERESREVSTILGVDEAGKQASVYILPYDSSVKNIGFDVTPAKYVTAIFTERGRCDASEAGLTALFSEQLSEIA